MYQLSCISSLGYVSNWESEPGPKIQSNLEVMFIITLDNPDPEIEILYMEL